jgi:LacI family transcriptional regulator
MAISQRDLAGQIGVSNMTVSRALRGESGISEKTRLRILDAARKAGLPLPPSSRVQENRDLLHVLCTNAPAASAESPFHGRLLAGLRRGAAECAAEMINCPLPDTQWPLIVSRKQVDGTIVVWGDEHNLMPHTDCPVPSTFIFYGPPHADVVDADNFGGGHDLGTHLARLGHRRVAYLGTKSRISLERLAGLRAGLGADGGDCPPELTLTCDNIHNDSVAMLDKLLAQTGFVSGSGRRPFTALMAYNDFASARIVMRLRELGFRVPEDVSVVGFDGSAPAWYNGPALTTCAIPLEELGAEAARMTYWRLEHPNAIRRKLALETELIEGKSTGKVNG